ncbi:MAG: hypothetical protein ACHQE6_01985 [Solirubrobacterales bacterium]
MHRPSWFIDGQVVVSNAQTCGINKDGEELYIVDPRTGEHTGEFDDQLGSDVRRVLEGAPSSTVQWVALEEIERTRIVVPTYYDTRANQWFDAYMEIAWPDFTTATLGELQARQELTILRGHGSPAAHLRTGNVPYIKVSDLRAGQVNINPTNRISEDLARQYWKDTDSGLRPFDLITPARTSKNIGDMAVLMPGQERIVCTKEVLILRPGVAASFNSFYLLWAMSLKIVRDQWQRIVFMQTNREDTGDRYLEIRIPVPPTSKRAGEVSRAFSNYYQGIAKIRKEFLKYLGEDKDHHIFLASSAADEVSVDVALDDDENDPL